MVKKVGKSGGERSRRPEGIPTWAVYEQAIKKTPHLSLDEVRAALESTGLPIQEQNVKTLHRKVNLAFRRFLRERLWLIFLSGVSPKKVMDALKKVRAGASRTRRALLPDGRNPEIFPEMLMSLLGEQAESVLQRDGGIEGLRSGEWVAAPRGFGIAMYDVEILARNMIRQILRDVLRLEEFSDAANEAFAAETARHREDKGRHKGDPTIKELFVSLRVSWTKTLFSAREGKAPRGSYVADGPFERFALRIFHLMRDKIPLEMVRVDKFMKDNLKFDSERIGRLSYRSTRSSSKGQRKLANQR